MWPTGYGTGHTSNGDPIGFGAALSVNVQVFPEWVAKIQALGAPPNSN
jgi:hypothetical protein